MGIASLCAQRARGRCGSLLAAYFIVPALGLAATMRAAAGQCRDRRGGDCARPAEGECGPSRPHAAARVRRHVGCAPGDPAATRARESSRSPSVQGCSCSRRKSSTCTCWRSSLARAFMRSASCWRSSSFASALGAALAPRGSARARLGARPSRPRLPLSRSRPRRRSGIGLPQLFDVMAPHATTWVLREVGSRRWWRSSRWPSRRRRWACSFPILLREVAERPDVGAEVGRLTALNTSASIAGSVLRRFRALAALGIANEHARSSPAICGPRARCGRDAAAAAVRPGEVARDRDGRRARGGCGGDR